MQRAEVRGRERRVIAGDDRDAISRSACGRDLGCDGGGAAGELAVGELIGTDERGPIRVGGGGCEQRVGEIHEALSSGTSGEATREPVAKIR